MLSPASSTPGSPERDAPLLATVVGIERRTNVSHAMSTQVSLKPIHSRRNSLKNATDHLHTDLSETIEALDLTRLVHYRLFLQATASALIAVEVLLEQAGVEQVFTDWPERTRRQAILADLDHLGSPAHPFRLHRPLPTQPEMFGMMYVLEGWRRDSKELLQRVSASSDPQVRDACAYLSSCDSSLWNSFIDRLESEGAANDQLETTSGAIYTFALFQRSFSAAGRQLESALGRAS
jgi:heme oxygenase